MAGLAGLAIVAVVLLRLFGPSAPLLGQATTLVAVLFLGGVQLICLGIIGEYLGRIYDEVKGRPLYLIDQLWGFAGSDGRSPIVTPRSTFPPPTDTS